MSGDTIGPLVRIEGHLDSNGYVRILQTEMLPFAREKLVPDFLFQQDGAPFHTSQQLYGQILRLADGRRVRLMGWFAQNRVRLLKTPPVSPDLSPIENMWAIVKQKLAGKHFRTRNDLWEGTQEAWKSIPLDTINNLYESMPNRIAHTRRHFYYGFLRNYTSLEDTSFKNCD
jgi:transposase